MCGGDSWTPVRNTKLTLRGSRFRSGGSRWASLGCEDTDLQVNKEKWSNNTWFKLWQGTKMTGDPHQPVFSCSWKKGKLQQPALTNSIYHNLRLKKACSPPKPAHIIPFQPLSLALCSVWVIFCLLSITWSWVMIRLLHFALIYPVVPKVFWFVHK